MNIDPELATAIWAGAMFFGYMVVAFVVLCLIAIALLVARQQWLEWRQYRRSLNLPPPDDSTRRFISAFERDWKTRRGSDTDWRAAA